MKPKTILPLVALAAMTVSTQAAITVISASTSAAITEAKLTPDTPYAKTIYAWSMGAPTATVGGVTYSGAQPSGITMTGWELIATNSGAATPLHYTGDLQTLMNTSSVSPYAASTEYFTLSNLVIGQDYQMLLTHHYDIGNNANREHRLRELNGGTASVIPGIGTVNYGDNVGQVTSVTFTAQNTSQSFRLGSINAKRSIMNSIMLATVPEPSSVALLGLGGLACLLRRRR